MSIKNYIHFLYYVHRKCTDYYIYFHFNMIKYHQNVDTNVSRNCCTKCLY